MKKREEQLNILRFIEKKPESNQRLIANELGFSLGKLNYCLTALRKKGLVKIKNFRRNDNKLSYLYLLTPKGINKKTKLTINFLQKRSKEYEEIQNEYNKIKNINR
jgi:EPS-associated MarR family transcriptional regulator